MNTGMIIVEEEKDMSRSSVANEYILQTKIKNPLALAIKYI